MICGVAIYSFFLLQCSLTSLLIPDEFQVAKSIANIRDSLVPYLDFMPYKNVLGYYFLTPFFSLFDSVSSTIIGMRLFLSSVFITALSLFLIELKKHFKTSCILLSFYLFLSLDFVLANIANLRIDSLSAAILFLIIRFLLRNDLYKACFCISIGFLISQKAAFYVFSIYPAIALTLVLSKSDLKSSLNKIIKISFVMAIPVLIYYIFWGIISSPSSLFKIGVTNAVDMGFKLDYLEITKKVWINFLYKYPVFFLLLGLATANTFLEKKNISKQKSLAVIFSSFVIICLLSYQSLWPYNFANFLPVSLILLPWLFEKYSDRFSKLSQNLISLCIIATCSYNIKEYTYFLQQKNEKQINDINIAEAALKENDTYISSFYLLFNHKSALPVGWVDHIIFQQSKSWSKEEHRQFINKTESNSPTLMIYDQRLAQYLPDSFKNYLEGNFTHFYSSIYTRSIKKELNQESFRIRKEGVYQLHTNSEQEINIEGNKLTHGMLVNLTPKTYEIGKNTSFKLQLIPDVPMSYLNKENSKRSFFPTASM